MSLNDAAATGVGDDRPQQPEEVDVPENQAPVDEKSVDPRNALNDLNATEWIPETVSVWVQRGLGANHPDAQIERQHPAPFSFTDVSRLIRFFTKRGWTVLDPFVGIGSTLKACALEGRKGIGIELNPRYAELTKERLQKEVRNLFASADEQWILQGDAREVLPTLDMHSVDFVVTSPPYCFTRKITKRIKNARCRSWTRATVIMSGTLGVLGPARARSVFQSASRGIRFENGMESILR